MDKQVLVDALIEELKNDFAHGDYTVLDGLLMRVPCSELIEAMPEEKWVEFKDVQEEDNQETIVREWMENLGHPMLNLCIWHIDDVEAQLQNFIDNLDEPRELTLTDEEKHEILMDVLENSGDYVISTINDAIYDAVAEHIADMD